MKVDPFLTAYTQKVNSKLITGLNVRVTTIKLLEESTGVNLCDLALGTVL